MKKYFLLLLFASNALASTSQTFVCDMRDLNENSKTVGALYKLTITDNAAVLVSGNGFEESEVATLSKEPSSNVSSTLFLSTDDEEGSKHSFDLLPSGKNGVLIWRNYSWKEPDRLTPFRTSVYICNKQ